MSKLTIEQIPSLQTGNGMRTMRIGNFEEGELAELKKMDHYEAKETLLQMLDERNNGIGTCWYCGYGTYGLWFDNEYAYMNIGTSCD